MSLEKRRLPRKTSVTAVAAATASTSMPPEPPPPPPVRRTASATASATIPADAVLDLNQAACPLHPSRIWPD
jgi:hypothetical protein